MQPKLLYVETSADRLATFTTDKLGKYVKHITKPANKTLEDKWIVLANTDPKNKKKERKLPKTNSGLNKVIEWKKQEIGPCQFEEPIEGGQHGTVGRKAFADLTNSFINWATKKELGVLFTVVDHNSAHHMTYLLAKYAFTKNGRKKSTKLLINFDQHEDFGKYNSPKIACSTWGVPLLDDQQDDGAVLDGYAVIGVGKTRIKLAGQQSSMNKLLEPTKLVVRHKTQKSTESIKNLTKLDDILDHHRSKTDEDKDDTKNDGSIRVKHYMPITEISEEATHPREDIKKLLTTIIQKVRERSQEKTQAKDWSDIDVYVTVDRDVMLGSKTAYDDGGYLPEDLRLAVSITLSILSRKKAKLVGFDVTGLPSLSGRSTWGDVKGKQAADILDIAATDIRSFLDNVKEYAPPLPKGSPKKSLSYGLSTATEQSLKKQAERKTKRERNGRIRQQSTGNRLRDLELALKPAYRRGTR